MQPAIVKIAWQPGEAGWRAELVLVDDTYWRLPLPPKRQLHLELGAARRCTGYAVAPGTRQPCPDGTALDAGGQCETCRHKDFYTDYVAGQQGLDTADEFSVYLAQCGSAVKVGVTKTARLEQRWVEQGADYAVEIFDNLSSDEALQMEENIADRGIRERVRKEQKTTQAACTLDTVIEDHGFHGEVVDVQEKTVYAPFTCRDTTRTGRFSGTVESVKGQIVSDGRLGLILGAGTVVETPTQKGLDEF